MRYIILADVSVAPRIVMNEDNRGPLIFERLNEAEITCGCVEDSIIVPLTPIISTLKELSGFLSLLGEGTTDHYLQKVIELNNKLLV